jgi:hypothetical protein
MAFTAVACLGLLCDFVQAEARQQAWAGTAAGRAALKSVKQVEEERRQGRGISNDNAKDWLS